MTGLVYAQSGTTDLSQLCMNEQCGERARVQSTAETDQARISEQIHASQSITSSYDKTGWFLTVWPIQLLLGISG